MRDVQSTWGISPQESYKKLLPSISVFNYSLMHVINITDIDIVDDNPAIIYGIYVCKLLAPQKQKQKEEGWWRHNREVGKQRSQTERGQ